MLMEQLLANENPELYNHHYQSLNEFTIQDATNYEGKLDYNRGIFNNEMELALLLSNQ